MAELQELIKSSIKEIKVCESKFSKFFVPRDDLSNFSHIVRTTLNHLNGYIKLTEDGFEGVDDIYSESFLKELVSKINVYFDLLGQHFPLMEMEVNGNGLYLWVKSNVIKYVNFLEETYMK